MEDSEARAGVKAALKSVGLKGKSHEDNILKRLAVRDETADPSEDSKGNVIADSSQRDTETIPLPLDVPVEWAEDVTERFNWFEYHQAIERHLADEVLEWVPDAFVDWDRSRIGYDLPFTRLFYVYEPPRPLDEIRADFKASQERILELLGEVGA